MGHSQLELDVGREPVLAATPWASNAHLIVACRDLGYLDDHVLDPTHGQGNWWTLWRPEKLTVHDLDPGKGDGVDYRALPEPDGTFDSVAFDPPYVSIGGRTTSSIPEFHDRYGMAHAPKGARALFEYNAAGFAECVRVLKRGGLIVYKCQDYIESGKYQAVTRWVANYAVEVLGLEEVDRLERVAGVRPQPTKNLDGSPRRQVHARRNLSTMLVFRKVTR
jgi:hypothetical protein